MCTMYVCMCLFVKAHSCPGACMEVGGQPQLSIFTFHLVWCKSSLVGHLLFWDIPHQAGFVESEWVLGILLSPLLSTRMRCIHTTVPRFLLGFGINLELLATFKIRNSYSLCRKLLRETSLIRMSRKPGTEPSHLMDLPVNDVSIPLLFTPHLHRTCSPSSWQSGYEI